MSNNTYRYLLINGKGLLLTVRFCDVVKAISTRYYSIMYINMKSIDLYDVIVFIPNHNN